MNVIALIILLVCTYPVATLFYIAIVVRGLKQFVNEKSMIWKKEKDDFAYTP